MKQNINTLYCSLYGNNLLHSFRKVRGSRNEINQFIALSRAESKF